VLTTSENILINCSPAEAWQVYQDLELRPQWDHNVERIWWVSNTGPKPGGRLAGVSKAVGLTIEWEAEVVSHDPPHGQSVRSLSGPFGFTATVTFEPFAGATRFTWTAENNNPRRFLGKMAVEMAWRGYRKELRSNLERFRALVAARIAPDRPDVDQLSARTSADVSRS
jgi:uncharacterized membrane protein